MVLFNDLPSELISTVLEIVDLRSLLSTAVVASSLQYPSERLIYHTVKFRIFYGCPYEASAVPAQQAFLQSVSSSERRARYVDLLSLQEINCEGEDEMAMFQNLERAMKLMANLKKLSVIGIPYIRHAHLESPTFSLTHLSLQPACPNGVPNPNEILVPIMRAHPELRGLSLQGVWSLPEGDIVAVEEQNSDAQPSAVLCPRLESVDSDGEEILQSLLVGRFVKRLILTRKTEKAGEKWGSLSMLPGYSHLEALVVFIDMQKLSQNTLPIMMARHLVSLTRLNVRCMQFDRDRRSVVPSYIPDPLILSIAQIQSLESLTLSTTTEWSTSQAASKQKGMVHFLYKSCPRLKEMFVKSSHGHNSHSHYGARGNLIGMVAASMANKKEDILVFMPSR